MENKIKELIDKYKNELRLNEKLYTIVESSTPTKNIIEDLKSLLKFKQRNCKDELFVSLLEIDNPVEFCKEVENLYLKHSEVHRVLRRKIMGIGK